MELKIEKQNENKLLNRTEIEFYVMGDGTTPSRNEVKGALQQKLKVDSDLIVIDRIDSSYGVSQVSGKACVYKDKGSMAIVPEYKLKRDSKEAKAEPPAGEATPAEEKPVKKEEKEAPKEKKEEKPAEEPKKEEKKEASPKKEDNPAEKKE